MILAQAARHCKKKLILRVLSASAFVPFSGILVLIELNRCPCAFEGTLPCTVRKLTLSARWEVTRADFCYLVRFPTCEVLHLCSACKDAMRSYRVWQINAALPGLLPSA